MWFLGCICSDGLIGIGLTEEHKRNIVHPITTSVDPLPPYQVMLCIEETQYSNRIISFFFISSKLRYYATTYCFTLRIDFVLSAAIVASYLSLIIITLGYCSLPLQEARALVGFMFESERAL